MRARAVEWPWAIGTGIAASALSLVLVSCDSAVGPDRPSPGFGEERVLEGRREVNVVWESAADGIRLSGVLYLPPGPGPHAVLLMHFGSNPWTREPWSRFYTRFHQRGIALLTYDKRGVGESEGECCPFRDPGYFELLAGDLVGAARAVREHPDIDRARVGLYGVSQGGWVLPVAAAAAPEEFAVVDIASGPAVTLGEELLYSQLTGDAHCMPSGLPADEIEGRLDSAGPSLFDPVPHLVQVSQPALWQFCENDTSIPVERSIRVLEQLHESHDLDFTIQRFGNCNHQFVRGGGMCQGNGPRVDWWTPLLEWLEEKEFTASGGDE